MSYLNENAVSRSKGQSNKAQTRNVLYTDQPEWLLGLLEGCVRTKCNAKCTKPQCIGLLRVK